MNSKFFHSYRTKKGIAALVTILSFGTLIFIMSLSTAAVTFWGIKNIDSSLKSLKVYYAAYSGMQDALLKLERNKDYFYTYPTFELSVNGTDDVTVSGSYASNQITITSTSTLSQINKKLQIVADINSTTGLITPTSTEELAL